MELFTFSSFYLPSQNPLLTYPLNTLSFPTTGALLIGGSDRFTTPRRSRTPSHGGMGMIGGPHSGMDEEGLDISDVQWDEEEEEEWDNGTNLVLI